MPTNEQLVKKGTIIAEDLAAAGKLSDAQSDKFLDYVFDETYLRKIARTVKFKPETYKINKIGVGSRVAMAKKSAVDPGRRRKVTTAAVPITPKEMIVPFEIEDAFKELNIEGDSVEDHIIRMMATQAGNDVEELSINGNLLGPADLEGNVYPGGSTTRYIKDEFLALYDGWITLAENAHIVDAAGADLDSSLLSDLLNALPDKFKRNRNDLRYYSSPTYEQIYREKVGSRQSDGGDRALMSKMNLTPYGVEMIPVPLWPDNPRVVEHIQLNGTTASALKYNHIPVTGTFVVTDSDLEEEPAEDAYVETTDYVVDRTNGTLARSGGSTIPDASTVKVTYQVGGIIMITLPRNLIVGISRDVRIEKDRNIYRTVNEYAITMKTATVFEEVDAVAVLVNLGDS